MLHSLGRKFMALVLTSGILLMGALPSWAATIAGSDDNMPSMTMVMMPGMAMPCNCADMMGKMPANQMPAKQLPCKNCNLCYAVCASSAATNGLLQPALAALFLSSSPADLFTAGANLRGIGHLPALPPPIA